MNYQQHEDLEDCIMNWILILASIGLVLLVLLLFCAAYQNGMFLYLLVGTSAVVLPPFICYRVKQWRKK